MMFCSASSVRVYGALMMLTIVSTVGHSEAQDWEKDHDLSYQIARNGTLLPRGGIYTDIYYTGTLQVFKGDSENQLAVKVKLVCVTPRAVRPGESMFQQPESPEAGVMLPRFYEKPPVGMTSDERDAIQIPGGDQSSIQVKNGDLVRISVPDHASVVDISLRVGKFGKQDVAFFAVSRPYREDAMRVINAQRARDAERRAVQSGNQVVEVDCGECKGTGNIRIPEEKKTCPRCGGKGFIKRIPFYCEPPIGDCNRTGKITVPAHDEPCKACDGKGKIRKVIENPLIGR